MHRLLQLRFSRRYEMGLRDHAVSDSDAILNRAADQRDLLRFLIQPRETPLDGFQPTLKGIINDLTSAAHVRGKLHGNRTNDGHECRRVGHRRDVLQLFEHRSQHGGVPGVQASQICESKQDDGHVESKRLQRIQLLLALMRKVTVRLVEHVVPMSRQLRHHVHDAVVHERARRRYGEGTNDALIRRQPMIGAELIRLHASDESAVL